MKAWMEGLDRARNGTEVLEGARDYCALFSPRELAFLPEDCREIRLEAPDDIARVTRRLSAGVAGLDDPCAEARRLRELLQFLARAQQRLGELG